MPTVSSSSEKEDVDDVISGGDRDQAETAFVVVKQTKLKMGKSLQQVVANGDEELR